MTNAQSITESTRLVATPEIADPDTPAAPHIGRDAWQLSDRLAWAMGLKVAPLTKLVAVAIAQYAGASSGLAWPGMGTLAADTGLSRSSVIRSVAQLERDGTPVGDTSPGGHQEHLEPIPAAGDDGFHSDTP